MQNFPYEFNSDSFQERIHILSMTVGGIGKLAKLAGVSESVVRKWREGKSEPKLTHLLALAHAGDISVNWLITGKTLNTRLVYVMQNSLNVDENTSFSSYKIRVLHSGIISKQERLDHLVFDPKVFNNPNLNEKDLVAIHARGDCMEPTISDESTLIIYTAEVDMINGGIYAFRVDNIFIVKRVQILINDGLLLLSDNKNYKAQDVTVDEVKHLKVLGRVVWVCRDV